MAPIEPEAISNNPPVIDQFSFKTEEGWEHSFLSNGHIEPDGSFVEREYQAAKAKDPAASAAILKCEKPFGPEGSKQMGRAAEKRDDWDIVQFQVMTRLVLGKFLDHPTLANQLLATGDALLIEGNTWHDNIWGDCSCGEPACAQPGLNWLGQILMSTREVMRQTQA